MVQKPDAARLLGPGAGGIEGQPGTGGWARALENGARCS